MRTLIVSVFLIIVCSKMSNIKAQWAIYDFVKVETSLINMQANIKKLFDSIQSEKVKMYGRDAPNGSIPIHGGMAVAYGSFFEDVERRLADIENITQELSNYMRICPDAPMAPPKPQNVLTESQTVDGVSTIVISWNPLPIIPENLQYKVYFQPLEMDGSITQPEVVFRICDASQTSASITDLAPRSQYRIRVSAVDGMVVESNSIPEIMRTPDYVPSPPVNLRGTPRGPNTIRLDWDSPLIMGEVLQYNVMIHDTFTGRNDTVQVRPAVNFYNALDLTEGTTHQFAVTAMSDNGESDQSEPLMVSTPSFVPPEVSSPAATAYNTTSIWVTFNPPKAAEGKIRGYRLHYTDFRAKKEEGNVETNDPLARKLLVNGLQPNKDYYFSLTAFTRRSSSFPTSYVATKSKAAVPSEVRNVRCRTLRTDPPMIQLRWEPPMYMYSFSPPVYHIMWGVQNGVFRNETVHMSVSWNSDYLDDNLLHRFIIAARNEEGIGREVEVQLRTPKREFDTPKNIKVGRMKKHNTTLLAVSWDAMPVPVVGFRVLHRVFQWVYQGRWKITEVPDPLARSTTIPIVDPTLSYIVVVRAKLRNIPRGQRKRDVMKCTIVVHKDKNAGAASAATALANTAQNTPMSGTSQGRGGDSQGMGGGSQGMSGGSQVIGGGSQGMSGGSQGTGAGSQRIGGGSQNIGDMGPGNQGMGTIGAGNPGMVTDTQDMGSMGGGNSGMGRVNHQGMGGMGGSPIMGGTQGMNGRNTGMGGIEGVDQGIGGSNQRMNRMGDIPGGSQSMSRMGDGNQGIGSRHQGMRSGGRPRDMRMGGSQRMGGHQGISVPQDMGGGMGDMGIGPDIGGQAMGGPGMLDPGMGGPGMLDPGMGGQRMLDRGMRGQNLRFHQANQDMTPNQGMVPNSDMRINQDMGGMNSRGLSDMPSNQIGGNQGGMLPPRNQMGGSMNQPSMDGPMNQGMTSNQMEGSMIDPMGNQGMPNNPMDGPMGNQMGSPMNNPGRQPNNPMGGPMNSPGSNQIGGMQMGGPNARRFRNRGQARRFMRT